MKGKSVYTLTNENGGSLQGYVDASYKQIVALFGQPNCKGDKYKVSTEWTVRAPSGKVVTIYDYKETDSYDSSLPSVSEFRKLRSYRWHIGAEQKEDADRFIDFLNKNLGPKEKCKYCDEETCHCDEIYELLKVVPKAAVEKMIKELAVEKLLADVRK